MQSRARPSRLRVRCTRTIKLPQSRLTSRFSRNLPLSPRRCNQRRINSCCCPTIRSSLYSHSISMLGLLFSLSLQYLCGCKHMLHLGYTNHACDEPLDTFNGGGKGGGFQGYCGYCNAWAHKRADCKKRLADQAKHQLFHSRLRGACTFSLFFPTAFAITFS